MIELPINYVNELASQTVSISALLGGFCLTVLVLLIDNKSSSKIMSAIFVVSIIAIGAFLVSIFAMTKVLLITTEGYPLELDKADLLKTRLIGSACFFLGILSVLVITSLSSGWTKSKRMGVLSTVLGIISLVLISMMLG